MAIHSETPVRLALLITTGLLWLGGCSGADDAQANLDPVALSGCNMIEHSGTDYVVCSYSASQDIRMFHADAAGVPYNQFSTLARELDEQGETLIFAMNGGMYHDDRGPVGFYRDLSGDQASVNVNDGPGNFHMKPNGVFWLAGDMAGITESQAYLDQGIDPDYATQSGPILVINGEIHPEFNADGTSHKRRNGVGVSADGDKVHFAISDGAVTFYDFAALFRDRLDTPNALFLDGQVSRLYATDIQRNEAGSDMGPIVGVVEQ